MTDLVLEMLEMLVREAGEEVPPQEKVVVMEDLVVEPTGLEVVGRTQPEIMLVEELAEREVDEEAQLENMLEEAMWEAQLESFLERMGEEVLLHEVVLHEVVL